MSRPRRPTTKSGPVRTPGRLLGHAPPLWAGFGAVAASLGISAVPFLAWLGLGVHRHAGPASVAAAAVVLVYGPALAVMFATPRTPPAKGPPSRLPRWIRRRSFTLAFGLTAWSVALFLVFPVYFPGERRQAVATGLGLLGFGSDELPQRIAARLPEEPTVATPEVAEAARLSDGPTPPPGQPLSENQIALPYEGEGRRLSVPVIFSDGDRELEVDMMFDTGATYTTLPRAVLDALGVRPRASDPTIVLHTANGEREAQIVLLDAVWLGDLRIDGVAIAVCEDCASSDVSGLLGLNVSGGFNVGIDADRREVVFTRRAVFDRKLDVKPFTDLSATFTRFPGGRVEVTVRLESRADRVVGNATTSVRCGDDTWTVELGPVDPGEVGTVRRRLPPHDACDQYEIALLSAMW